MRAARPPSVEDPGRGADGNLRLLSKAGTIRAAATPRSASSRRSITREPIEAMPTAGSIKRWRRHFARSSQRPSAVTSSSVGAKAKLRSFRASLGLVRIHPARYFLDSADAPVVKRTSRRSPEPQVRVRFPAGAQQNFNEIKDNSGGHGRQRLRLCPDCAHCYSLTDFQHKKTGSAPKRGLYKTMT